MGSDRARVSFDPSRGWRGVVAQQGRITVEADWNEAQAIAAAENRSQLLEIVGGAGTVNDGYRLLPPAPATSSTAATTDLTIRHGSLYVGGVRVTLDQDTPIGSQPDWHDAPAEPAAADQPPPATAPQTGSELIYLLLREQEVSAVEDPALREVALGGPDTAQRTRIVQRVLRHPVPASVSTWLDGWTDAQQAWANQGYTADATSMRLLSAARLQASFVSVGQTGPCQPAAEGGYVGADNQLIRVQICGVQNGQPVVAWGYDNASFLYRISAAAPGSVANTTVLTLASTPVDTYHQPQPNQAVEVLLSGVQLAARPVAGSGGITTAPPDAIASAVGIVTSLTADGGYDSTNQTVVIGTSLGAPYDTTDTPVLFLRIWQGQAVCTPGTAVSLGDTGLQVTLTNADGSPGFHVGDYWQIAVRPGTPDQVYPARLLSPQPPDGPLLLACPLALVTWANGAYASTDDARSAFSTLAALTRDINYVAVRPSDVADGAGLQALLDSMAGRASAVIKLLAGAYTLPAPLMIQPGNAGLTIEGGNSATLQASPSAQAGFAPGLIVVNGASGVTLRGLSLNPPLAPFTLSAAVIASLSANATAQAVVQAVSAGLQVSFGIQAVDAPNLTVADCTVGFPATQQNLLAAGIVAPTGLQGLRILGNSFIGTEPQQLPFADLASGNPTNPPYQVVIGCLQLPIAATAGVSTATVTSTSGAVFTQPWLHDGRISNNLFDGITVPLLLFSQLGTVYICGNTARICYGGFWLVSGGDLESLLDSVLGPLGLPQTMTLGQNIYGPLTDRIFLIAAAVGQSMTYQAPPGTESNVAAAARPVARIGPVVQSAAPAAARTAAAPGAAGPAASRAQTAASAGTAPITTTGGETISEPVSTGITAPIQFPVISGIPIAQPPPPIIPIVPVPIPIPVPVPPPADFPVGPDADAGNTLTPRVAISENQLDAVLPASFSGAGLIVMDLATSAGSVVVTGNRIRSRIPAGATAWLTNLLECVMTGNTIRNEAYADNTAPATNPYSLIVIPGAIINQFDDPVRQYVIGVVVSGNLLVGASAPVIPLRPTTVPAPLNDWTNFNSVASFSLPTPSPSPVQPS